MTTLKFKRFDWRLQSFVVSLSQAAKNIQRFKDGMGTINDVHNMPSSKHTDVFQTLKIDAAGVFT